MVRADIDVQGLRTHLHKSLARNWVNTIRTSAAHPVFLSSRVSETISCEDSAIFFAHLAYIPHVRQNHSTFPPILTKIKAKKVISTEVPGQM